MGIGAFVKRIEGSSGMVLSACHPRREIWARSRLAILGGWFLDHDWRTEKRRGSFKGAIRIPMSSLMLFCNDLALSRVSCKSLKFQSLLFFPMNLISRAYRALGHVVATASRDTVASEMNRLLALAPS
jgi:hypothetical protein